MSRRPVNLSRRFGDSGGGLFSSSKSKTSPALSVGLIIVVMNRFRLLLTHGAYLCSFIIWRGFLITFRLVTSVGRPVSNWLCLQGLRFDSNCFLLKFRCCDFFLFYLRAFIYFSSLLLFIGGFGSRLESVSRLQGTFLPLL